MELGKVLVGIVLFIVLFALGVAIGGAFVWVAFWLLHGIIAAIPVLTFSQAVIVGIVLSIIGSFFK